MTCSLRQEADEDLEETELLEAWYWMILVDTVLCQHVGVSKNRGTPKWMVNIMEHPIKNGVPACITKKMYHTPWKFNSLPLKNDGWKMNFLLGFGNFLGAMLNFRGGTYYSTYCTCIESVSS